MRRSPLVIVGAGLAGLHAGRLLRAAGVDFVLIEARDRLGGRILSVDHDGQPADDGFDLGPSWYWPSMQPAIADLIAALDLPSFPQQEAGDVLFERMRGEAPQRFPGSPQGQGSFRLAGGIGALVRALGRELPPNMVHLGTRVTAMSLSDDGVDITTQRADGIVERLVAAQVIAAVPPRLLEASVTFIPAHDSHTAQRWRASPTWMAPHAKFVACYDRPFWRDAGLAGTAQSLVGPMAEMHDATTASGRAALFGFVAIGAPQRAALGEVALTRACLEQLERLFGAEARRPRASMLKDWAADPFTAAPADRESTGHVANDPTPWVSGPWQTRLTLAGSETSMREPGYLSGAVTAAAFAVEETLKKLAG